MSAQPTAEEFAERLGKLVPDGEISDEEIVMQRRTWHLKNQGGGPKLKGREDL
jgi:hypothetical protein